MSKFEGNHAPPKDLLDEETVFSLDDSLDGLPLTPLSRKNDIDSEFSHGVSHIVELMYFVGNLRGFAECYGKQKRCKNKV